MAEAPTAPEDEGVFTAVRLVVLRTCPAMPSMPHVIHAISSCLDDRTLETATKIGSTLLLDRFAAREWPEAGEAFREARFLQNVEIAASEGHVNALNWWRTKYLPNHHPSLNQTQKPLICSHPEVVQCIREHAPQAKMKIWMSVAAWQGDLKFMKWAEAQSGVKLEHVEALRFAASAGNLDVVQHLIKLKPWENMYRACRLAAEKGHQHVVQWLLANTRFGDAGNTIDSDHTDKVKLLLDKWRTNCSTNDWIIGVIDIAAARGEMELLRYLYERIQPNTELDCTGIESGKIEKAQWLRAGETESDEDLLLLAVETGNLDMVKWVHCNSLSVSTTTKTMDRATLHGLVMVKWLHVNRREGCTQQAMDTAAEHGDLEMVQFLNENRPEGCSSRGLEKAAANGQLDVVNFIVEHKLVDVTMDSIAGVAENGHLEIVKLLHTNENAASALSAAAYRGHLKVIKWLGEPIERSERSERNYYCSFKRAPAHRVVYRTVLDPED